MLILISYALELGRLFYRVKHGVLVGRPPNPRASSLSLLWAGRAAACSSSVIVVGHRRRRRGVLRRRGASERARARGLENFAQGILGFSESSAVFCFSHRWVLESSESVAGGGGGVASQSFEEFWTKKVKRTGK